jgi:molybdate transport system substrate-binding protein
MTAQATGEPLVVYSTLSAKEALLELVPQFELASGVQIDITYAGGSVLSAQLAGHSAGDLFIGPDGFTQELTGKGVLRAAASQEIARSTTGLAVAASLPPPDIATTEKLKALLCAVPTVSYSPGASGIHFAQLLERFGLADVVALKTVLPRAGELVGSVVARGAAAVGVQQISELLPIAGIRILALPPEFRQTISYLATPFAATRRDDTVAAFVNYLRSPGAHDVWQRKGLQPC